MNAKKPPAERPKSFWEFLAYALEDEKYWRRFRQLMLGLASFTIVETGISATALTIAPQSSLTQALISAAVAGLGTSGAGALSYRRLARERDRVKEERRDPPENPSNDSE